MNWSHPWSLISVTWMCARYWTTGDREAEDRSDLPSCPLSFREELFSETGLPAYRSPETRAKGMKLRLSEVAEFACLEPLQYQLKGLRLNAGSTRERILHGTDSEYHQHDYRSQRHHHQPVRPAVPQAKEVGEAYCHHPPKHQNDPQNARDALLGCHHAHPPCVTKPRNPV